MFGSPHFLVICKNLSKLAAAGSKISKNHSKDLIRPFYTIQLLNTEVGHELADTLTGNLRTVSMMKPNLLGTMENSTDETLLALEFMPVL